MPGGQTTPNRPFCEEHRTVCSVGRTIGGWFGGGEPRKRSRCGTVQSGAIPAPWMRATSLAILAHAFDMTLDQARQSFSQGEIDEFYTGVVVPYCRALEGEIWDQHPDSAEANAWRASVYEQLKADLKSGRVPIAIHPPGYDPTGGTDPIGTPGGGSNSGGGGRGSAGSSCPPGTFEFLGVCWGANAAGTGRGAQGAGSPRGTAPGGPGGALAGVPVWVGLLLAGGVAWALFRGRS